MTKTVVCRFVTGQSWSKGGKPQSAVVAVLDIHRQTGGAPQRLSINQSQTLKLNYGDRIKCVSGSVGVLINPGTTAGMFILFADSPSCTSWNYRTELVMDDETTKQHAQRGKVHVTEDIGNTSRITSASSETWWQR